MRKKYITLTILTAFVIAAALWGPIVSNVEQARYSVAKIDGSFEIRDYPPMIVAETEVTGDRKQSINEGFRIIADFIFGNNQSRQKVAMTAPVIQEQNKQIAMTSPVAQQGSNNNWKVRFVMPSEYTLDTLPRPNNTAVKITGVAAKRFAVIRFSGLPSAENLSRNENDLNDYINKNNLKVIGSPTYAFYNPPWTLPFLRRNEVLVEIVR